MISKWISMVVDFDGFVVGLLAHAELFWSLAIDIITICQWSERRPPSRTTVPPLANPMGAGLIFDGALF